MKWFERIFFRGDTVFICVLTLINRNRSEIFSYFYLNLRIFRSFAQKVLLKSYTIEIAKGMVESPLGSWSRWWPRHIAFNHHDLMFASGVNMGNVGGMGGVGGVGLDHQHLRRVPGRTVHLAVHAAGDAPVFLVALHPTGLLRLQNQVVK